MTPPQNRADATLTWVPPEDPKCWDLEQIERECDKMEVPEDHPAKWFWRFAGRHIQIHCGWFLRRCLHGCIWVSLSTRGPELSDPFGPSINGRVQGTQEA